MRYILRLILPFTEYESDIGSNHPSENFTEFESAQAICPELTRPLT
jgi:hypothetical protein